jgi:hypothetical protein
VDLIPPEDPRKGLAPEQGVGVSVLERFGKSRFFFRAQGRTPIAALFSDTPHSGGGLQGRHRGRHKIEIFRRSMLQVVPGSAVLIPTAALKVLNLPFRGPDRGRGNRPRAGNLEKKDSQDKNRRRRKSIIPFQHTIILLYYKKKLL